MSDYADAMETAATDGRRGDLVRDLLIRSAKVAGLAAGVLCLAAACGTAVTTPPASSPSATPGQGATQATTPADSPSSPGGSSGPVTAQAASGAQVADFTAAAQGQCGFDSASDTLTYDKVTNNGWGIGTINADNPQDQGNGELVFRLQGTSWVYNTCGSDFSGSDVPMNVIQALM
jgi:hypothetical protein